MDTSTLRTWLQRHVKDLAAMVIFALVTVAMTLPLVTQLGTHLPGRGDDLLVHYWNGWRTQRLLREGGRLYYTDLLFHPVGVSLLYANLSWMNIAMWLVLEPLLGGIAAFNAFYLLNFFLCAVGMYALMRYLIGSRKAAMVAGLVHAFWPYRLFEIGHPNLVTTQWIPLFLLFLIRTIKEDQRWRDATLAAVFLTLTGYARWQLLVLAAIGGGLYALYSIWFERNRWTVELLPPLVLIVVLSLVLMAPAAYPIIEGQLTRRHPEDLFVESIIPKQTDLLGYVVPPHNHPLDGLFKGLEYADDWDRAWYSNAYVGYVVLILAVIGIARTRRMAWFWAGLALTSWLLAIGPAPRINKQVYAGVPLPYRLVEDFLPIRVMREPRRFNMLLAIPFAVAAGYGVRAVVDRLRRASASKSLSRAAFAVVTLLICVDYSQIPVRTFDTAVSPFYETLGEAPERFGLLNLPTGRDRSPYYMLCQTVHGKPIVEGSVARPPREAKAFVEDNPFLRYLRDKRMMNPETPDISRQLAVLQDANIPYLIINELWAFPWEKENWRTYIAYEPVYSDRFVSVYRTDPQAGRDFTLEQELAPGIGLTEVISSTSTIGPNTPLETTVMWATSQEQDEDLKAELALTDAGGERQQVVTFEPVSGWPTSKWPANALGRGHYAFRVDPRLPGGAYDLTLSLVDPETGERRGRATVIREDLGMEMPPRLFTRPAMETVIDARFGEALHLLGYDARSEDDTLVIGLYWQALRRMDESFKFFFHLYDRETGEIVAQQDAVPRDWTYPTDWWEAGEIVLDDARLSLQSLSSDRYELAVGVYDPETGERLPIMTDSAAASVDDRRLFLIKEGLW